MEHISFKNNHSSNPYFSNIDIYEYMTHIDNMLIIKTQKSQLFIFHLNKSKNEAIFHKSIKLICPSSLLKIDLIDSAYIILIFTSGEIYLINLETEEEHLLSFNASITTYYDSITMHEQIELNDFNEGIPYGFLSIKHKAYLVTLTQPLQSVNTSKKPFLHISFIKDFNDAIKNIVYHHISINNVLYCFICIGFNNYCLYRHFIINNSKTINAIKSALNKEWYVFFKEPMPSSTYILSNIDNHSIHSLTSNHYLYSAQFNLEYNANMNNELIITISQRPLSFSPLINDLYHNESSIFILSNQFIEEISHNKSDSVIHNCEYNDKFIMGKAVNSSERNNYMLFLTHHSLVAITIQIAPLANAYSSNYTLGIKKEASIEETTLRSHSQSESQSHPQHSSKTNSTMNKSPKAVQCSSCDNKALYRCNKCHLHLSCSNPSIHTEEWSNHALHCAKMNYYNTMTTSKDNNEERQRRMSDSYADSQQMKNDSQASIIMHRDIRSIKLKESIIDPKEYCHFFNSPYAKQREEIFSNLKANKVSAALPIMNTILSDNIQQITIKRNMNRILSFDVIEYKVTFAIEDLLSSFQQYFEYFTNLLLLIHIYAKLQAKDKLWRTMNYVKREMEAYNYSYIIQLIIEHYRDLTDNHSFKRSIIAKCEEILIGVLKYSIALVKYSYCLGEFSSHEQYLFDFIEKMQRICPNNQYILSNMYLLIGNLYLKYNMLKKAHILYEEIIDKTKSLADLSTNMYQVVLCANYNSGVIYFTIGKFAQSKQRMETAIKIKQEYLKESNDIQMIKIYLTLAEIEVEFNSYSNAYQYLQKASEAKDFSSELDADLDKEFDLSFEIKEKLLKEFLLQNVTEENVMNDNDSQNNFMLKHFGGINNKPVNSKYKLIQDFIKDRPPAFKETVPINQLKLFFLFMSQLSKSQIKQLNDDQPIDLEANKRLPIVFSLEFKSSLSQVQSLALSELQMISLTRVNVLKNYLGKIKINNLNYNDLYVSPQENNLTIIQNGYLANTILRTWEVNPDLKKELLFPKSVVSAINSKDNPLQKTLLESIDDSRGRKGTKTKDQQVLNNIFKDNDMIDYDKLLVGFKNYCRENAPEKEQYVTEEFILMIGQEMKSEELMKICTNQELIPILIDAYIAINSDKSVKKVKFRKLSSGVSSNLKALND